MSVTESEFLAAVADIKAAGRKLKNCKPGDTKLINSIMKEFAAAQKTISAFERTIPAYVR